MARNRTRWARRSTEWPPQRIQPSVILLRPPPRPRAFFYVNSGYLGGSRIQYLACVDTRLLQPSPHKGWPCCQDMAGSGGASNRCVKKSFFLFGFNHSQPPSANSRVHFSTVSGSVLVCAKHVDNQDTQIHTSRRPSLKMPRGRRMESALPSVQRLC